MDLYAELMSIVDCLESNAIDYAICGGLAVALHGYPRFTGDIDIMVLPGDLQRLKESLKTIDYTIAAGPFPFDSGTPKAREVHRISKIDGSDVFTLDILVVNRMLDDAWKTREIFGLEGRKLRVVSRPGLAAMKRLAGRDRDLLDIKMLEGGGDGE